MSHFAKVVDNKVTELNPFTDISPITISVNKNDTISFNITNGNSVSSIKLEANYTSDKVGFLINGELNPTLNLKKNSRYNFKHIILSNHNIRTQNHNS